MIKERLRRVALFTLLSQPVIASVKKMHLHLDDLQMRRMKNIPFGAFENQEFLVIYTRDKL
jgi:hypothetical protein